MLKACLLVNQTKSSLKTQRGQVLIMATLSLTLTFGVIGLVVDVGWAHFRKQTCLTVAESASIAGAKAAMTVSNPTCGAGLTCQAATECPATLNTPSDPIHAACLYAQQNGFTNGANGGRQRVLIAANTIAPPVSGVSPNYWISATVSEKLPLTFLAVLGQQWGNVAARSTAGVVNGPNCIYALDPSASGSLHADGGDNLTSNCGVIVDSNSSTAITAAGPINAPQVGMVGKNPGYSGTINSSKISTGILSQPDPLAYVQAPAVGDTCNFTNYSRSSGAATLNPGVYCGGITLSNSANVTLTSGTYILKGGGLNMSGNATLQGTGVTIYNTGTASTYRPIFTQDDVIINLTAPTSGPLVGILFFQDRSISSSAENILGGGSGKFQGALYFPTTPLVFSSQQNVTAAYTIIVAKTINIQINSFTVANDYSSLATGSPIKFGAIYE